MGTVGELVDKGDIPEERKDNVKMILHDLGYAANRAVGKAFLKINEHDMTDASLLLQFQPLAVEAVQLAF